MSRIELDAPLPPPAPRHPIDEALEELKGAPINASILFDKAEARAAHLFVRGDWVLWRPEGDDGAVRYRKVKEPEE